MQELASRAGRAPSRDRPERTRNEKAHREHVLNPRRGHAGPGGPEEDPSGGFAHGGWSANYWDDQMFQVMSEAMSTPFDLVLGRKTYEIFAAHWPYATDDAAAKPLNDATKYVASRTLRSLDWSNSVLIEGDVGEGIAALKQQKGPEL